MFEHLKELGAFSSGLMLSKIDAANATHRASVMAIIITVSLLTLLAVAMGGAFPRHTFSARIAGENRGKFSFPLETLEGKTVCVIGKIARDASRAEIEVSSPSGLKLANIK